MAESELTSIATLVRSLLDDARKLIREEIALAQVEIREEAAAARRAGVAFSMAAMFGLIAVVLLCVAMGGAVAWLLGAPTWVGHGIVALLLAGAAAFFSNRGVAALSKVRLLPVTTASLKENIAWMQGSSRAK